MSKLALKLIAENKKTRSPFLDLGNCGLSEVPTEIGEPVGLEELSFASEQFSFDGKNCIQNNTHNIGPENTIERLDSANFLYRTDPEFSGQKRLLQRKRDGKLKVECPASYKDVDVLSSSL